MRRRVARLALTVCAFSAPLLTACVRSVAPGAPRPESREALLVLPGFGFSREAQRVFRAAQASLAADGVDLYAPDYVVRGGLDKSRDRLRAFIESQHLSRYQRLHVFAFIAGAWTLNPLLDSMPLPNLVTIVYDRSPMQERAPRIAHDRFRFLTRVRYGRPVSDMARTPYPALGDTTPRIGILIETRPTSLIRRFDKSALRYGPLRFDCAWAGQRHDDCAWIDLDHDEMYLRFAEVLPEILAFMRTGRFSPGVVRTPPAGNPLAPGGGQVR